MQRGLAFRAVQMQQTLLRWSPSIFHPGHLSPCSLVPTLPRAPSWKPSTALIWEHFLSPVPGAQRHGGNRERGPVFRKRPCRSSVHILGRRPACMSSEERAEQRSPPAGGGWLPAAQPQPEASLLCYRGLGGDAGRWELEWPREAERHFREAPPVPSNNPYQDLARSSSTTRRIPLCCICQDGVLWLVFIILLQKKG